MTIRLLFYRIFTDTEIAFFDETGDKMGYYNREGKKLDTRNMRYLDSGSFGAVYLSEDKIVKIYHPECIDPFEGKITLEVFDILKEIHHPNFIELLDVYSNLDLLTLFCRKFNLIYHFQIDAYTAKYYLNSVVNPLLENKDYLLDNLRDIMDLMDIFTQEKIRADDLRSGNMILTKENMIIIDPDYFRFTILPSDRLIKHNKESLFILFKDICSNYLEEILFQENPTLTSSQRIISADKIVNKQFSDIHITEQTDIPAVLSKRLKSVKKPVELFERKQN